MAATDTEGFGEWVRWAIGGLIGAVVFGAASIKSWVSMRRDVDDHGKRLDKHRRDINELRVGFTSDVKELDARSDRLERFESSAVEKLDSMCERVDDLKEQIGAVAGKVDTLAEALTKYLITNKGRGSHTG